MGSGEDLLVFHVMPTHVHRDAIAASVAKLEKEYVLARDGELAARKELAEATEFERQSGHRPGFKLLIDPGVSQSKTV